LQSPVKCLAAGAEVGDKEGSSPTILQAAAGVQQIIDRADLGTA